MTHTYKVLHKRVILCLILFCFIISCKTTTPLNVQSIKSIITDQKAVILAKVIDYRIIHGELWVLIQSSHKKALVKAKPSTKSQYTKKIEFNEYYAIVVEKFTSDIDFDIESFKLSDKNILVYTSVNFVLEKNKPTVAYLSITSFE